ncbi:ATP-dependent nuclease [Photobacterium nomapromontoriensis]|uniref:ATP-dependent nuclease n=1 Tax=Photobacterium nomapromontoriensis TaxID=2910237 RepID=UPI003D12F5B9
MEENKFYLSFTEDNRWPKENEVLLWADDSSWNDFGYKIHCVCRLINPQDDRPFEIRMLIGFFEPESVGLDERFKNINYKSTSLMDMLPLINSLEVKEELDKLGFFTMLPDMQAYRTAVSSLGSEVLEQVLSVTNDVVLHKDKRTSWFDHAINTEVFTLGFMRNSEAFFAFSNADSILGGVEDEKFDGISQKLTLKYSLEGFENTHEINLDYEQSGYIPKRINILIGKNGLGKSQALKSFCRAALRYPDNSISLTAGDKNERPLINRLLAIATPGETQNTFPGERRTTQKLYYRRLSLTRNGRAKATKSINEMLVQLARSDDLIGTSSRWELFIEAISKVLPVNNIAVQTRNKKYIQLYKLHHGGGEQASLERWASIDKSSDPKILLSKELHSMSSGQLTFFKFAVLCCLYIENGSFVLLDEPETHMHPNMISDFVELLDSLLEETGSQALIATHSAYFVREVSRDQVHVFSDENNRVSIVSPRLRTFGADVESISQFIFNEDVDNRLVDKIYSRVKNLPFEKVKEQLEAELVVA